MKEIFDAFIRFGNKGINLGSFETEVRASIAYRLAVYQSEKFKKYVLQHHPGNWKGTKKEPRQSKITERADNELI